MHLRSLLSVLASVAALTAADKFDDDAVQADADVPTANLNVKLSTVFPQSEIFGVKLVNGHSTEAVVSLENNEPNPVALQVIGGSLWTPDFGPGAAEQPQIVRNISTQLFRASIPAGEKESFAFTFQLEMHPADLVLKLIAIVGNSEGAMYTMSAFEGNVSVVEAPQSIFDPKLIFLYVVLGAGFAGTAYFVYNTWISTLFPQQGKRRGQPTGVRPVTGAPGKSPARTTVKKDVAGGLEGRSAEEIAAQATGARVYDESWIPAQHLKRPDAKRIRSGTPTGKKVQKPA